MLQASVEKGLPGCRILHPNTPNNVLQWLRDYHNQFHGGHSRTPSELLLHVDTMEEAWSAQRTVIGITAKSKGYESQYW
eukprot:6456573-Amphidinium_carterae.1